MFFSIGVAFVSSGPPTRTRTRYQGSIHSRPESRPESPRKGLPKFHSHHIDSVKMRFLCLPGAYGSSDVSKTMLQCAMALQNSSPSPLLPI